MQSLKDIEPSSSPLFATKTTAGIFQKKIATFVWVFLLSGGVALGSQAWAADNLPNLPSFTGEGVEIRGTFTDHIGHRIRWSSANIKTVFKTSFGYLKDPKVTLYFPNYPAPLEIESNQLKIDHIGQNFFFEKNVKIKMPDGGLLKTDFSKVSLDQKSITSFDKFSYKSKQINFKGRGFMGAVQRGEISFFNVHGASQKIIKLPILKANEYVP